MWELAVRRAYWGYRDLLLLLNDASHRDLNPFDEFTLHHKSGDFISIQPSRELIIERESISRCFDRVKYSIHKKIGIEIKASSGNSHEKNYEYTFLIGGVKANYIDARLHLDWAFGVLTPYTYSKIRSRIKKLQSRLDVIKPEEFLDYVSPYNLGFIVTELFTRGIGHEKNLCFDEVLKESSDGLLKSAGLERFASFFSNPRKLLHIIPHDVNLSEMPRLEEINPLFNIRRRGKLSFIFHATDYCPGIPSGGFVSSCAYHDAF
ncbi:hypothetical protein HYT58_01515 [Candidatus Woesearchaeota archaeon]|nr:hypothetical protein [Candidatus Woesearchaeota archaeon]